MKNIIFNTIVIVVLVVCCIRIEIYFQEKRVAYARQDFYEEFGMTPEEYMESRPDWGFEER